MIAIVGLVVVIYPGLRQPRKFCEPVISGHLSLNIALKLVKKCHPCQVFTQKMRLHPAPLHPVITIGPFTKWGVDFVDCNPTSAGGNQHIIMAIDYFTKWVEAMPTVKSGGKIVAFFVFNQIISRFGIPSDIC
jgi:hypothetical protein